MKILFLIIAAAISVYPQNTDDKSRPVKSELKDVYKKWVNNDVSFIFTPDERRDYLKLRTEEEREKFVQDYWKKRESDPENGFGSDRYERIGYADGQFTSGSVGSKTDRGRVYILWDEPKGKERGLMRIEGRDAEVPFEKWLYDWLDIVFIDPAETGDYRLIKDEEKERK